MTLVFKIKANTIGNSSNSNIIIERINSNNIICPRIGEKVYFSDISADYKVTYLVTDILHYYYSNDEIFEETVVYVIPCEEWFTLYQYFLF